MRSLSVTIEMKAIEYYFCVVLFVKLYKVVLTSESVDEILRCTEQQFPLVLFITSHMEM